MKSVVVVAGALGLLAMAITAQLQLSAATRPLRVSVEPIRLRPTPAARPTADPPPPTEPEVTSPASTQPPPVVVPVATIYGREGSFGTPRRGDTDPFVDYQPVDGWGFLPGQAAYFSVVDERGRS